MKIFDKGMYNIANQSDDKARTIMMAELLMDLRYKIASTDFPKKTICLISRRSRIY